jgi:hypothetical protein
MPGWYQFCPPDAALASGASSVAIHLKGATNMAPVPIEIDLAQTSKTVNAVSNNLDKSGYILTQTFPTNFSSLSIDGSGKVSLQATQPGVTIPTVTTLTTLPSIPSNWLTSAGIDSTALGSIATACLDGYAVASDSVQGSPSPTTTTFAGSSSLSSSDNFYVNSVVVFTSGSMKGLARKITSYTGATRLIAVASAWPVAPTSGNTFRILGRID